MLTVDPGIRELCTHHPLAIPLLYRHGIDANGAGSLEEGCRARGLEPTHVLAELAVEETRLAGPWHARTLASLIDHILRTYHRPFATTLDEAETIVDAMQGPVDQPTHADWAELRGRLGELRIDMEQHMAKEERVLFPWLRGRADTAAVPIRAMQLEHADTLALVHAVHAIVARCLPAPSRPVEQAAAGTFDHVEHWLCEHIHLENNELFPRALEHTTR